MKQSALIALLSMVVLSIAVTAGVLIYKYVGHEEGINTFAGIVLCILLFALYAAFDMIKQTYDDTGTDI